MRCSLDVGIEWANAVDNALEFELQVGRALFGVTPKRLHVNCKQLSVIYNQTPIDNHLVDGGAGIAEHQLTNRRIKRDEAYVA